MKQDKNQKLCLTSDVVELEDSDRETEIKAINRILDRRYEILIQLS